MIDTLLNFVIILTLLSIAAAIIFFVRKNGTFGKMFLLIALGAFVIGVGLTMMNRDQRKPEPEPVVIATEEPSATIEEIMQSSVPFEHCNIELDQGTMTISVWEDGVAEGALKAMSGDTEAVSEWNDLLEMFCEITNTVSEEFSGADLGISHVSIVLLNERNQENILATVTDGEIVYNVVEE